MNTAILYVIGAAFIMDGVLNLVLAVRFANLMEKVAQLRGRVERLERHCEINMDD